MNAESLYLLAAILVSLTAVSLLLVRNWRLSIGILALQYVGVFILVTIHLPLATAVTKLVSGWMAGAVLGIALASVPRMSESNEKNLPQDTRKAAATQKLDSILFEGKTGFEKSTRLSSSLFFLFAATLMGLIVYSQTEVLNQWLPDSNPAVTWGGFFLLCVGLLRLSFTAEIFHTILGLLVALSGFEVLYAAIQPSLLMAALLATVNLGLALVGAYLLLAPHMENEA